MLENFIIQNEGNTVYTVWFFCLIVLFLVGLFIFIHGLIKDSKSNNDVHSLRVYFGFILSVVSLALLIYIFIGFKNYEPVQLTGKLIGGI